MFGYASDETSSYAIAYTIKSQLLKTIRNKRLENKIMGLGPMLNRNFQLSTRNKPVGINSAVLSIQHLGSYKTQDVKDIVLPLILSTIPKEWNCPEENIYKSYWKI